MPRTVSTSVAALRLSRRKLTSMLLLAGCASGAARAWAGQQTALKVGDMAPTLAVTMDSGPFPGFQKGRIYVLEFWATWCGPCLAAFAHLNQLVRSVKDAPVTVLSITNDEKGRVANLLKTRPLETQLAYDSNSKTFDTYGVQVIPHTVVVDGNGRIAAITSPTAVTFEVLRDVYEGKPLNLPEKTNIVADLNWDKEIRTDAPEAVAHVVVQRSNADSGAVRFRPNSGRITGDGVSLGALIQTAYGANYYEVRSSLPEYERGKYRVSVSAPDGKDATARALLVGILPTIANFTARWQEEETLAPVLKRIPGTPVLRTAEKKEPGGLARTGEIEFNAVPMSNVAAALGNFVYNAKVFDETGYLGIYDIKIEWTPGDQKSLDAALKTLGLQVVMGKRKVRRLIVQPNKTTPNP